MKRFALTVALSLSLLGIPYASDDAPPAAPKKPDVQTKESQAAMTPAQALQRLKEGTARFVGNATKNRDWSAKVTATASGQYPFAAVLGCMDSRSPAEIIFDEGIGDLFGLRVAGNTVNEDELGSLEYAVLVGTKLIVVVGHTSCGAVKGAIDKVEMGNLTDLLTKIRPAIDKAGCSNSKDDACVTRVAEKNVLQAMKEIRERSTYIAEHLEAGKVGLVGAMYDIGTGKVTFLED
jgi:carbonic anhydrase